MNSDDPIYTRMLRRDAIKYRYQLSFAPNGGVVVYDELGDVAAAFSDPQSASEWMEKRLADFQREVELVA